MLNKEDKGNVKLIKKTAKKIWGSNVKLGKIKILESPYPEFEWSVKLYNKFNILLIYDRSILDIAVITSQGRKWLTDYTSLEIYEGFDSTKPENMLHNFIVLDEVVKKMLLSEATL